MRWSYVILERLLDERAAYPVRTADIRTSVIRTRAARLDRAIKRWTVRLIARRTDD